MDVHKCVLVSLNYIVLVCILASGIVNAQWKNEDVPMDALDETHDFQPMERPVISYPTNDPEFDWRNLETNRVSDNTIDRLLKRGGFQMVDGYSRLPRIKQRIVPFYSYGRERGGFRSKPRYVSRLRKPYGNNPWNTDVASSGDRYLRRHVYDAFKK